ncbi:hypothetical protein [Desulfofundulus thermosubterraneus]|uniref:Uncharacterized protein n=1 Tax=Desulfofundulus thermosubterraneus DSM 16057 TaxID=1121432 RepID=A0A1M6KK69_9FIRM|nr:hypothetical protein [Desulfofundulus thermosubterraneus]SHJ59362.1 hypothetical protein SAMN02745219_02899 [Desulfofundulus thermosubterraneus DSM 16057]
MRGQAITRDEFNRALYYAVREDLNGVVDEVNDGLIRRAIEYVESGNEFPDTPYVCLTSVAALARAANRRGIPVKR